MSRPLFAFLDSFFKLKSQWNSLPCHRRQQCIACWLLWHARLLHTLDWPPAKKYIYESVNGLVASYNLNQYIIIRHRNYRYLIGPWETLIKFDISDFQVDVLMTSSNGNIFRVTGPLCGEFTGHRWIPRTKASDTELWCFLWSVPEPTVQQTMETPMIWEAIAFIMTSL